MRRKARYDFQRSWSKPRTVEHTLDGARTLMLVEAELEVHAHDGEVVAGVGEHQAEGRLAVLHSMVLRRPISTALSRQHHGLGLVPDVSGSCFRQTTWSCRIQVRDVRGVFNERMFVKALIAHPMHTKQSLRANHGVLAQRKTLEQHPFTYCATWEYDHS